MFDRHDVTENHIILLEIEIHNSNNLCLEFEVGVSVLPVVLLDIMVKAVYVVKVTVLTPE